LGSGPQQKLADQNDITLFVWQFNLESQLELSDNVYGLLHVVDRGPDGLVPLALLEGSLRIIVHDQCEDGHTGDNLELVSDELLGDVDLFFLL
jgi:hypothetical protein